MDFNIDIIIITSFLIINLLIGIYSGRGITTLKHYAIGNRNFSTATIAATIIATWIAGSSFSITTSETCNRGLYFIIPGLGDVLSFFIIAYFYAPRVSEFLGNLSVAEAMGNLYGNGIRCITAVSGIFPAIGNVAMQFSLLAALLSYIFGISGIYATIISSLIVIIYSSFGGIKSVTFTDIIQFSTFGIVLPIVTFLIWQSLNDKGVSLDHLKQDPLFNYAKVLDYRDPNFVNTIFLFLFFMIPGLDPAIFQRITMAKNTLQVSRSFIIAGIFVFICDPILNTFVGILLRASNINNLNSTNIVGYILDTYICVGFKGLFIIGIMSMIMSTADSYINSSAILFAHDFCKSLKITLTESKELLLVRLCALFIGIIALLISLFSKNLLDLMLSAYSFYMPIVSVPLILAIFGFRSTNKSVFIGMMAGFVTVITFKIFSNIDSLMPGMISNLIFFVSSHYLLRQPGGWIGIKDIALLESIRFERKRKIKNFIGSLGKFNLLQFCKNNSPKEEKIYVYFGFFCFMVVFSHAYSIQNDIYKIHSKLLNTTYYIILTMATIFITYPAWTARFKKEEIIAVIWNVAIMAFVFINSLIAILNNLNQIQFSIFMTTLIVISVLSRWKTAIFIIIPGVILSLQFYKVYAGVDFIAEHISSLQLQIVYLLMLIISILIAFIKPTQQLEENAENINAYLTQQSNKMQLDLIKLSQHREEFINRLDHRCIDVFLSTYNQIKALEKKLNNQPKKLKQTELIKIVDKLKTGANYLNEVIGIVKNKVKINPTKVNLEKFLYIISDEYKKINRSHEIQISINYKSNIKKIEIDQNAIKKVLSTCMDHGLMKSNTYNGVIIVADTEIEYNLDPNILLKTRIDALELSIIFDVSLIKEQEINQLINPTFTSIDEINFAENYKIIAAHYGKMLITLNKNSKIVYSIIIPSRLKEIRPKKTENPDYEFEKINIINDLMSKKTKELICDIAKQLVQAGVNINLITKITKLTPQEINFLDI